MSDDTLLRARWRQVQDRAERDMQQRMSAVRERFPCRFSGGNIKMLVREGGNCLDDFFDGPWAETEGRDSEHAASAARELVKSMERALFAYVAAHLKGGPEHRIWQGTVEIAAILTERVELAIADARSGKDITKPVSTPGRVGRRAGVGGYQRQDMALIERIHAMIKAGGANSCWEATLSIIDEIPGAGTDESRRKRVATLYNQTYPAND